MQLSPEREAELVEQNMPKIYRAVDNFVARHGDNKNTHFSYDDFVQEVSIVFLKYIRRCETEDQIGKFPWYDSLKAMSELVLRSQPLSVHAKTANFTKTMNSLPETVSYEVLAANGFEIDGMSKHWAPDVETKIDFDAFLSDQSEIIQRIVAMRIYGLSHRMIGSQCGISDVAVIKKMKKLKEEYDEFDKEDDEDE